jgi:hypothetical protein
VNLRKYFFYILGRNPQAFDLEYKQSVTAPRSKPLRFANQDFLQE